MFFTVRLIIVALGIGNHLSHQKMTPGYIMFRTSTAAKLPRHISLMCFGNADKSFVADHVLLSEYIFSCRSFLPLQRNNISFFGFL
jgi:hypothetical protein